VRKRLLALIIIAGLSGAVPALGAETPQAPAQPPVGEQQVGDEEEGSDGMLVFGLVFLFALLFVLSSATALNTLGGKPRANKDKDKPRPRPGPAPTRNKMPQGKERFRL
jgi:hypothetical protein